MAMVEINEDHFLWLGNISKLKFNAKLKFNTQNVPPEKLSF